MIITKVCEIFAEAIPAGVLQAYAFVKSPNRSAIAAISIVISALTTGFGSALISYDNDTSPAKRRQTPQFYGFVPPTGRGIVFFLMLITATSQFAAKIMSIALLAAVSRVWVAFYMLLDIGLFFMYTIFRSDFWYFIPFSNFSGALAHAALMRLILKVITDFTCLIQTRNPIDLGGIYWSANLVLSQASVVVCAFFYHWYYDEEEGAKEGVTRISSQQLFSVVGALSGIFFISFLLFIVRIERKYVSSFFSTETGHSKVKRQFLEGTDDFSKAQIFRRNKRMWASIQPQVAKWLDQNWERWEREKPDWFSEIWIAGIDTDILPARASETGATGGGKSRRRSSFLERVSVRMTEEEYEGGKDGAEDGSDSSDGESSDSEDGVTH